MEPVSRHPDTLQLEWALRELLSALSAGEFERLSTAKILALRTLAQVARPSRTQERGS